jgi:hypothetical protein
LSVFIALATSFAVTNPIYFCLERVTKIAILFNFYISCLNNCQQFNYCRFMINFL